ncbi:MAG: Arm DNA-binding domain-containing protein [Janthinobacterium lividum]
MPLEKARARFAETGGPYLVMPTDSKHWCRQYRIEGNEKRLALGNYSTVSRVAARCPKRAAKSWPQRGRPCCRRKSV